MTYIYKYIYTHTHIHTYLIFTRFPSCFAECVFLHYQNPEFM